ncbi:MAG: rhomboid family protein [Bacteroidetes bacterium OLB11]|nr:MAG: rhomboid family protein [Bacteroidetes bacterium OLB11]
MNTKNFSLHSSLSKSDVVKLIIVHALIFVLLGFTQASFLLTNSNIHVFNDYILNQLTLPLQLKGFAMQPWSILTHIFVKLDFIQLFTNLIWLWIFSSVIEDLKGNYRIIPIYLVGGMFSGLVFMLYMSFFGTQIELSYFSGSIGALWAVVGAAVGYKPKYAFSKLLNMSIPIWIIAVVFLIFNILMFKNKLLPMSIYIASALLIGYSYNTFLGTFFEKLTILLKKNGCLFKQ